MTFHRISLDALEQLAFDHPGSVIEPGNGDCAHLELHGVIYCAPSQAAKCGAQTYWYENGTQRARWCDEPATMEVRALDGSHNRACDEHGARMIAAGAAEVTR